MEQKRSGLKIVGVVQSTCYPNEKHARSKNQEDETAVQRRAVIHCFLQALLNEFSLAKEKHFSLVAKIRTTLRRWDLDCADSTCTR